MPTANPPLDFSLKTLDAEHPALLDLGLEAATLEYFGAGYCGKGILKGRLAIPIHNSDGKLVAYTGLALDPATTPRYLFPPKFHPALEVFNLDCLAEGEGPLYLTPEIEGVLRLTESEIPSVLGLFDGSLSEAQEEAIAGELAHFEGLVLVGEGFADHTVARLARHATVSWVAYLPPGQSAPARATLPPRSARSER
jgi:hypothetical protein